VPGLVEVEEAGAVTGSADPSRPLRGKPVTDDSTMKRTKAATAAAFNAAAETATAR
jgi:hypothetical protein